MSLVVLYRWHYNPDVGGVDPVFVEGDGVEQGVAGAERTRAQAGGVDGADDGQGAVGPRVNAGRSRIECGRRLPVTSSGSHREGDAQPQSQQAYQ